MEAFNQWNNLLKQHSVDVPMKSGKLNVFKEQYTKELSRHDEISINDILGSQISYDKFSSELKLNGQPSFAYLRRSKGGDKVKVHFTYCKTLKKLPTGKFHCTTRNDGLFEIDLEDDKGNSKAPELRKLQVCSNCISKYFNISDEDKTPTSKEWKLIEKLVNEFDYKQFIQHQSLLLTPNVWVTKWLNLSDKSWQKISEEYRIKQSWTCESCKIIVGIKNRTYLHTHHINHDRNLNHDINLIALCIKCHASEDGHKDIMKSKEYSHFQELLNQENFNYAIK